VGVVRNIIVQPDDLDENDTILKASNLLPSQLCLGSGMPKAFEFNAKLVGGPAWRSEPIGILARGKGLLY